MAINDEHIRLILDLVKSGQSQEAINMLEQYKAKVEQAGAATDKLGKQSGNTGYAFLTAGRAIQDFTQGGIGGILNNIEGLTVALGLGTGLAGILTVVGVAAFVAGPAIKSFFKGLIDGSNEIPPSADKLKGLDHALKETTERLEELRKQQKLTNTELAEFVRLTVEQTRLEREVEAARAAKKMEETLNPQQRTGADVVKRATEAFGGKRVLNEVARALDRTGMGGGDPQQAARNLLFNVQQGDIKAQDVMRDVMARGSGFTDIAQVLGGGKTPEEEAKIRNRAAEQLVKDRDKERERRDKEKQKADKLVDDLNQQGLDNQRQVAQEADQTRQKAIEEARKMSNQVKEGADAQRNQGQQIDIEKMRPLRDPNAAQSQFELNQILQENQAITASNEMIIARQNINARQIQQQLRQVPNVLAGQQ